MMGKRLIASVASIALAVALGPSAAFASDIAAAELDRQSAGSADVGVSTQAKSKTKTMYMLTSVETKTSSGYTSSKQDIKYNSKKLVRKIVNTSSPQSGLVKLTYNGKGAVTSILSDALRKSVTTDVKGRITGTYFSITDGTGSTMETTNSVSYRAARAATSYTVHENKGQGWTISWTNQLTNNKKKLPIIVKGDYFANDPKHTRMSSSMTTQYSARLKYDKKKNLTFFRNDSGAFQESASYTYKNKYDKKGNLVKRVSIGGDSRFGTQRETLVYTYKAVKVPAKMVAKAKAQQWALLNGNMNFSLSSRSLGTNWDTMTGLDDFSQIL